MVFEFCLCVCFRWEYNLNSYAIFTSDSSVEYLTNALGIRRVCVMFFCTNELVWMNVNRSVSCELDIAYDWNPWYEYIQQPLPWPQCRPDATPRPTGDCPVDWPAPCSPAVVFPLADPEDVLASHVGRDNAAFHPLLSLSRSLSLSVCLSLFFIYLYICWWAWTTFFSVLLKINTQILL